jgi:hypothetical protein
MKYYRSEDGKCPVEDFLESLNSKEEEKIYWVLGVLGLLEDFERIPPLG